MLILEFGDGVRAVDKSLFAGIERMAFVAQLNADLFLGRAGRKSVSAGTNYLSLVKVVWMNIRFHCSTIIPFFAKVSKCCCRVYSEKIVVYN